MCAHHKALPLLAAEMKLLVLPKFWGQQVDAADPLTSAQQN